MLLEMLEKEIMSGVIFITHDLPVLRTVADQHRRHVPGPGRRAGPDREAWSTTRSTRTRKR